MPDTTKCPHCGVEMEVPPSLRDQEVECPSCAKAFLPVFEDAPVVRPHSRRRRRRDDDDQDFDEFDPPSPERRRRLAEGRLRPAAIWLIMTALLRLAFCTIIVAFSGFMAFAGPMKFSTLIIVAIMSLSFLKESATIYGAWQMLNARSYGWGLAAGILMLIPSFDYCCWLFYLGFGVWAIVAVNDSDARWLIREKQKTESEMEASHD